MEFRKSKKLSCGSGGRYRFEKKMGRIGFLIPGMRGYRLVAHECAGLEARATESRRRKGYGDRDERN
jgi:hypothetical protein